MSVSENRHIMKCEVCGIVAIAPAGWRGSIANTDWNYVDFFGLCCPECTKEIEEYAKGFVRRKSREGTYYEMKPEECSRGI